MPRPAPLHHLQPRDPDVLGEQGQLFYAFLRHFSIILSVFLIWTVCLSFPSGFYVLSVFYYTDIVKFIADYSIRQSHMQF